MMRLQRFVLSLLVALVALPGIGGGGRVAAAAPVGPWVGILASRYDATATIRTTIGETYGETHVSATLTAQADGTTIIDVTSTEWRNDYTVIPGGIPCSGTYRKTGAARVMNPAPVAVGFFDDGFLGRDKYVVNVPSLVPITFTTTTTSFGTCGSGSAPVDERGTYTTSSQTDILWLSCEKSGSAEAVQVAGTCSSSTAGSCGDVCTSSTTRFSSWVLSRGAPPALAPPAAPQLQPRCGPFLKDTLNQAGDEDMKVGGELWALGYLIGGGGLGTLNPLAVAIGAVVGDLGAGVAVIGGGLQLVANFDPADPNYRPLAPVDLQAPPPFTTARGLTPEEVATGNLLIGNLADQAALQRAMLTTIFRAQGAYEAGDTQWETAQVQLLQAYEGLLAADTQRLPGLVANLRTAFARDTRLATQTPAAADLPPTVLTAADLAAFQADVRARGLPAGFVQAMTQFGADAMTREQVRLGLLSLNPNDPNNTGTLGQILGNPNLGTANTAVSQALTASATSGMAVTLAPSGGGTVAANPAGPSYEVGTRVAFTATPAAGQVFLGWVVDDRFQGWANPLTITVNANHSARATFAAPRAFPDLPGDPAGRAAVDALSARGIIRGQDGLLGPNDPTLRAQMAAIIARAIPSNAASGPGVGQTWDTETHPNAFPDRGPVDTALWGNVGTLNFYGVAKGYADGTYGPTNPVLYQQVVLFVSRAMVTKGYWTLGPDTNPYPNLPADSPRAQEDRRYIATYVANAGPVPDTTVGQPWAAWDRPATRVWFARAIYQALDSYFKVDRVP